jgi:LEA14-like dessication related protein
MPPLHAIALLPVVLLGWLIAGCAGVHQHFDAPRVWLTDISLDRSGDSEQTYRLGLRIQNPNRFPLSVRGTRLLLELDGGHRAAGMSELPFAVPAFGETRVSLPVTGRDAGMMDLVGSLSSDTHDAVVYRLEGKLNLANDMPPLGFSESGRIAPKPPHPVPSPPLPATH